MNTSNIETNEITNDETQYFQFEDEFKSSLECFAMPQEEGSNILNWIVSFKPPATESEHIVDDGNGNKKVSTRRKGITCKSEFCNVNR